MGETAFEYDALGRCIGKTVRHAATPGTINGVPVVCEGYTDNCGATLISTMPNFSSGKGTAASPALLL